MAEFYLSKLTLTAAKWRREAREESGEEKPEKRVVKRRRRRAW